MGSALQEPSSPGEKQSELYNRSLHRFSIILAAFVLALVILGGPVAGIEGESSLTNAPVLLAHQWTAATLGLLAIVFTAWLWLADPRIWMRKLGLAVVAALLGQGLLGAFPVLGPQLSGIVHASLTPLILAMVVAIAVFTSESWLVGTRLVFDAGWPSLRSLATTVSVLVLVENVFGASFRHRLLGPVPHIAGAAAGTALVLIVSIFVLSQHSGHQSLRQSALALLLMTLVELFLGIGAYIARLSAVGAAAAPWTYRLLAPLHAAIGALTLAAGVTLAIQVSRNVRKPAPMPLAGTHSMGAV